MSVVQVQISVKEDAMAKVDRNGSGSWSWLRLVSCRSRSLVGCTLPTGTLAPGTVTPRTRAHHQLPRIAT